MFDCRANFLLHRNERLGRPLAEEPALVGVSLLNEAVLPETQSPAALCEAYPQWRAAWEAWIAARRAEDPAASSLPDADVRALLGFADGLPAAAGGGIACGGGAVGASLPLRRLRVC